MGLTLAPEVIINHRFRRGGSGKKDRLDKEAEAAHESGMSYGKYKALQKEGRLPPAAHLDLSEYEQVLLPHPAPETMPSPTGAGRYVRKRYPDKPCAICGKLFSPRAVNAKYCGEDCRHEAGLIGSRELCRKFREKRREVMG